MVEIENENEEILADIIKRIIPDKIIVATGFQHELDLKIKKENVTITVEKSEEKQLLCFEAPNVSLSLRNIKIDGHIIEFWYYRFKDLLASYEMVKGE